MFDFGIHVFNWWNFICCDGYQIGKLIHFYVNFIGTFLIKTKMKGHCMHLIFISEEHLYRVDLIQKCFKVVSPTNVLLWRSTLFFQSLSGTPCKNCYPQNAISWVLILSDDQHQHKKTISTNNRINSKAHTICRLVLLW